MTPNAPSARGPSLDGLRVTVLVAGDVGRSPRMQYHALALAAHGASVDLVGYAGSRPLRALLEQPLISLHLVTPPAFWREGRLPRAVFAVSALLRLIHGTWRLLAKLAFALARPDVVLVQSPPALPALVVALAACRLRSSKLVVDWHNFSFAMLGLKLGPESPIVRVVRWWERQLGQRADDHLCVSEAMRVALAERWGIPGATVLYDLPAEHFAPAPLERVHELFRRLDPELRLPGGGSGPPTTGDTGHDGADSEERTAVTRLRRSGQGGIPGRIELRPERPGLLLSSTSWTEDEDFSLLLDAAVRCDEIVRAREGDHSRGRFPDLAVLITGRGPLRDAFEARIGRLALRKVHLRTLWLDAEDYALLLGAVDLGLCFHRSASGVDLPMKLADMLGAGLPVCALDYGPCLTERFQPGETGLLFGSAEELAEQIYDLFRGFPAADSRLEALRRRVRAQRPETWSDGWRARALPLFLET